MQRESSSPDVSLAQDESFVAISHRGLIYPFGDRVPGVGETASVARGIHWIRLPVPGLLNHINCWLLDGGIATTVVDTGLNIAEAVAAWRALFVGSPLAERPLEA